MVRCGDGTVVRVPSQDGMRVGDKATLWVRASDVRLGARLNAEDGQVWRGKIDQLLYYGDHVDLVVEVEGIQQLRSVISAEQFYGDGIDLGSEVTVGWRPADVRLFTS